jgi:hypothetical protein
MVLGYSLTEVHGLQLAMKVLLVVLELIDLAEILLATAKPHAGHGGARMYKYM